ncbi:hypothetical protein EC973_007861 [Apophysomyces ossiformis]|uniref:RecA family profile 1 domain-containing protein n=1 Tax=Apophysomyces ossiformis TaxID=679940 RepID=A0A8H7BU89_9FUNG|nr:hypothetical protein EC973_007861 [Apophysomyces ossiformis]
MEEVAKKLGIYTKLEQEGLDAPQELLIRSEPELKRLLGSPPPETIHELLDAAAAEVYPWGERHQTCRDLISHNNLITSDDDALDQMLGGGITIGAVTEVVGESSSGKTQFVLQLCLTVQKPAVLGGLGGSAVYLHSEGRFPSARLDQLTEVFCRKYDNMDPNKARQSIHTMPIPDNQTQYRVLAYQLPVFLERHRDVRLIVLDSISANYRSEKHSLQDNKRRFERLEEICDIGSRLKKLAHQYGVAVIVVNQVSDSLPTTKSNDPNPLNLPPEHVAKWMDFQQDVPLSLFIHSLVKKPVLGLTWSNAVNIRIRFARSPMMDGAKTRRAMFVDFSPVAARCACEIVIGEDGVRSYDRRQHPHKRKRLTA